MSPKEIIQDYFNKQAVLNPKVLKDFLHPELQIEWVSGSGVRYMNYDEFINYSHELSKSFVQSSVSIRHIIEEGNKVVIYYTLFMKSIENPNTDELMSQFMAIWEMKEGKMYQGTLMSRLP